MLTPEQKEIVRRARDRIADPQHWCRLRHACTTSGSPCRIGDDDARKFCAVGALTIELRAAGSRSAMNEATTIGRLVTPFGLSLAVINDIAGHAAVLAIFDKALKT